MLFYEQENEEKENDSFVNQDEDAKNLVTQIYQNENKDKNDDIIEIDDIIENVMDQVVNDI